MLLKAFYSMMGNKLITGFCVRNRILIYLTQTCKNMKYNNLLINFLLAFLLTFSLTSCDVVGGIFEAGMWTGLIGLVLVILLVFWIFNKIRR